MTRHTTIDQHKSLQSRNSAKRWQVQARNLRCIQYGDTEVELSCVEQLVEISQVHWGSCFITADQNLCIISTLTPPITEVENGYFQDLHDCERITLPAYILCLVYMYDYTHSHVIFIKPLDSRGIVDGGRLFICMDWFKWLHFSQKHLWDAWVLV